MDSQKKTTASTTKSGGSATSSRRATEKPSATTSVARPEPHSINPPTTHTAQIPTTSTPTTTPPMIPLSDLEKLLKLLQPNLDLTKTLAALSNPPETTPSQPISQPSPIDIPMTGIEEGREEWGDVLTRTEAPEAENGEEEVYSGSTEVVGEDDDKELGDDAGSRPVQEEEQAGRMEIQAERMEEEQREQAVDQQSPVEDAGREGGMDSEGESEVRMPSDEGRVVDVIELIDEEEAVREASGGRRDHGRRG